MGRQREHSKEAQALEHLESPQESEESEESEEEFEEHQEGATDDEELEEMCTGDLQEQAHTETTIDRSADELEQQRSSENVREVEQARLTRHQQEQELRQQHEAHLAAVLRCQQQDAEAQALARQRRRYSDPFAMHNVVTPRQHYPFLSSRFESPLAGWGVSQPRRRRVAQPRMSSGFGGGFVSPMMLF